MLSIIMMSRIHTHGTTAGMCKRVRTADDEEEEEEDTNPTNEYHNHKHFDVSF